MTLRKPSLMFILLSLTFLITGCGGGETPLSSTTTISSPDRVVAIAREGKVTLNWRSVAGATSYTVYVSTDHAVASSTFQGLADEQKIQVLDTTSLVINDLLDGQRYYFIVTANGEDGEGHASQTISAVPKPVTTATIRVAGGYGDITIELFEANAPVTVANFIAYAKAGFYNDTLFHRVIDNFMIQGGGYTTNGMKTTNSPIKNESDNFISNQTGTIAMARLNAANSATAQFFINVANNPLLDYVDEERWGYAVFGRVIAGMDVVNAIKIVTTNNNDAPLSNVLISSIDITEP